MNKDFKGTWAEIEAYHEISNAVTRMEDSARRTAMEAVKSILKRCKNNTLSFSDTDDPDEMFSVDIDFNCELPQDNYLVDAVNYDENSNNIFLVIENKKFYLWEFNMYDCHKLLTYMIEELELENVQQGGEE